MKRRNSRANTGTYNDVTKNKSTQYCVKKIVWIVPSHRTGTSINVLSQA